VQRTRGLVERNLLPSLCRYPARRYCDQSCLLVSSFVSSLVRSLMCSFGSLLLIRPPATYNGRWPAGGSAAGGCMVVRTSGEDGAI